MIGFLDELLLGRGDTVTTSRRAPRRGGRRESRAGQRESRSSRSDPSRSRAWLGSRCTSSTTTTSSRNPGTSAGDHLASGLVPVAILVAAAACYPRLPTALRAAIAMTFGALGLAIGFPGAYYLLHGSASGAHYTGLLAIVAGGVLLVDRAGDALEGATDGESRRRRYLRRALADVLGRSRRS